MSIAVTLGLLAASLYWLRAGLLDPLGKWQLSASPQALGLAVLSIVLAMYFFSPMVGLALILTIVIHEYGHVVAFRICGHVDARFRLVPLMGGVAISNKRPDGPVHDFFISLMGPAFCIAPTLLAYAIASQDLGLPEIVRVFIWQFAHYSAALNFFNLLPIGPLDGGKMSRILIAHVWPKAERPFSIAMMGVAILLGLLIQSIFLVLITALSLPSALEQRDYVIVRKPTTGQMLTMLAAYLLTGATFLLIAWPIFVSYFL